MSKDNETITKANFPHDKNMLEPSRKIKLFRKEFQKICKKHDVDAYYLSARQEDENGRKVGTIITSSISSKDLKIIIDHAIITHARMVEVEKLDELTDLKMQ